MRMPFVCGLVAACLVAAPAAMASTLPHADFGDRPTIGLGLGPNAYGIIQSGVSAEASLGPNSRIGISAGAATTGTVLYEARGLYRLVEPSGVAPAVVAIGGGWGGAGDLT